LNDGSPDDVWQHLRDVLIVDDPVRDDEAE
jgi:hypothetical protein